MSRKKELNLDEFLADAEDLTQQRTPKLAQLETLFDIKYNEFEVSDEEKNKLIECEHNIFHHKKKTVEHILMYCEALYQANQIFSNHDKNKGCWRKWLDGVQINPVSANIAINRYKFYKELNKKGINNSTKILEMPRRTLQTISSQNEYTEAEIIEIVSAENPTSKLNEIKDKKQTKKLENKEEEKTYLKKLKVKKTKMIEKLKAELKQINERLQNL